MAWGSRRLPGWWDAGSPNHGTAGQPGTEVLAPNPGTYETRGGKDS